MIAQAVILILSAVSGVIAAPAPVQIAGIKLPLLSRRMVVEARSNFGTVNIKSYLSDLDRVLHKYDCSATIPRSLLSKRSNEPLTDHNMDGQDALYYSTGLVGVYAPPQPFTFEFDTGSSDLLVPGPSCGIAQGCPGPYKYNRGGMDEGNITTVMYGSKSFTGENYFDSVTIAGLKAEKQNLVSLTTAQGFSTLASDALLGMAFQSIAYSGQPPYFQTLIAEGKVTVQEFAFYFGRIDSGTQGASELTLGGRDASRFTGEITQVPVISQGYWQVVLDALTLNGEPVDATTRGEAAIDTGTAITIVPAVAAAALFRQIPGSFPLPLISGSSAITLFSYPCGYSGVVAIQFAGRQFEINPLDFNFGRLTASILEGLGVNSTTATKLMDQNIPLGGLCLAAITGADLNLYENFYVVGDSFLKNWYSIFSFNNYNGMPSVSFAAAASKR